jgi:hypothetical protein
LPYSINACAQTGSGQPIPGTVDPSIPGRRDGLRPTDGSNMDFDRRQKVWDHSTPIALTSGGAVQSNPFFAHRLRIPAAESAAEKIVHRAGKRKTLYVIESKSNG